MFAPEQRGSDEQPLVVRTTKSAQDKDDEAKYRQEEASGNRTGVILNVLMVLFTAILTWSTVYLWIETRRMRLTVNEGSADVKASIAQATRAADAMGQVAKHVERSADAGIESVKSLKEITARQMRAYLSVIIGGAIYQDRAKNIRFEAKPLLVNDGNTPAYKVGYRAKAAILPLPLPDDFEFPLVDVPITGASLGPGQNFILNAVVDDFVDDGRIENIKRGQDGCLYVWGIVTYEDLFGVPRETSFGQFLHWLDDGHVMGNYIQRHNDAT